MARLGLLVPGLGFENIDGGRLTASKKGSE
jgi:hypothetical protein